MQCIEILGVKCIFLYHTFIFKLKLHQGKLKQNFMKLLLDKNDTKDHDYTYHVQLFYEHLIHKDNKNVYKNFNGSIKLKENERYEIKLPVKNILKVIYPIALCQRSNALKVYKNVSTKIKNFSNNMIPFSSNFIK